MGIYKEHFTTTDDTHRWDTWEVYEQSAWRHAADVALKAITLRTGPLERLLEGPLERLHELRCHDDCTYGTWYRVKAEYLGPDGRRLPGVDIPYTPPPGVKPGDEGSEEALKYWDADTRHYCGRMPLPAQVDVFTYEFGTKGRRKLGTVEGAKHERTAASEGDGPSIAFSEQVTRRLKLR